MEEENYYLEAAKKYIICLLDAGERPTAAILLKKLEEKFDWKIRHDFIGICEQLAQSRDTLFYSKYFALTLNQGEIKKALVGGMEKFAEYKSSLDALFVNSKVYKSSINFTETLKFCAKFKEYAPYNSYLVKIQNPSCSYYATPNDWWKKFSRTVKEDARPMLILAPMHPVITVFDIDDTEGKELPKGLYDFIEAKGELDEKTISKLIGRLNNLKIHVSRTDYSTTFAGYVTSRVRSENYEFQIRLNKKHTPQAQFATLLHETAHIFLGHIYSGKDSKYPIRFNLKHNVCEIEAESVSYLVCQRIGIKTGAPSYLAGHIKMHIPDEVSLDLITKVANKIEMLCS